MVTGQVVRVVPGIEAGQSSPYAEIIFFHAVVGKTHQLVSLWHSGSRNGWVKHLLSYYLL